MLEHHRMMLCSIKYVIEKWHDAIDEKAYKDLNEYKLCSERVEIWLNLCLKYQFTGNKDLLQNIVNEIPTVFKKERECLCDFVFECIDWKKLNENHI